MRGAASKTYGVSYTNLNKYYPAYQIRGLVDNNKFYDANIAVIGSAYERNSGHAYHSAPLNLGGPEAIYVENNIFESDAFGNLIDSNRSGAYVSRFNTYTKNGNQTGSVFEAHSLQAQAERGSKKWEIYNNTVSIDQGTVGLIRSGTGVFFGNTLNITAGGENSISFSNNRDSTAVGGMGICDGTHPDFDSNEDGGWLCRDQVGAGSDQSASDGTLPYPIQDKVPAYAFNNTPTTTFGGSTNVKVNRDYYTQGVTFDGSTGVGVGVAADRPVTCTTGVGYWATDEGSWNRSGSGGQGRLYKCTSANTWELYYTPYTYPHPLQGVVPHQTFGTGTASIKTGTGQFYAQ
jgi:hypothetical protein